MMWGHAIGDVLGLPYEGRANQAKLREYDGLPRTQQYRGRGGYKTTALGQGSDDTEMAVCLLDAIVEGRGTYTKEAAVTRYLVFANNSKFTGCNTRDLLTGIKTIGSYERRYAEKYGPGTDPRT